MGRPIMKRPGRGLPESASKAELAMGSASYAQYAVARKPEGRYKLYRGLAVAGYILFPMICIALIAVLGTLLGDGVSIVPIVLGAFTPLLIWMLVHFTWPYLSHTYYYEIDTAQITFSLYYGSKKGKELFSAKVRDFSVIAPASREHEGNADRAVRLGAEVVFAASSREADDLYFGICEKDGRTTVVYFEATEQSLKCLKHYNSAATVVTATRK